MIKTHEELRNVLKYEKNFYLGQKKTNYIKLWLLRDHNYLIWKYVKALRYTEYHFNLNHKLLYWVWQRKKNTKGSQLGITIWHNSIDKGLIIWHYGSIIVNGNAKIGMNCQLHGDNCIGNKGMQDNFAPTIGDNVDVGVGAKIIGNIYIADNVKIGANAVVTKSCYNKGATLVGIPAKEIQKNK